MKTLTKDQFEQGLSDARIRGVSWVGDDLHVELELAGDQLHRRVRRFCFKWATGVRIDLDFTSYMGPGMLWSAEAYLLSGGHWQVRLDCAGAPPGGIAFECEQICEIGE